jgi:hypothetical protein
LPAAVIGRIELERLDRAAGKEQRSAGGGIDDLLRAQRGTDEGLQAIVVSCGKAQKVAIAWSRDVGRAGEPGASRSSCAVRGYRCLDARTERGLVVSCAQPGRTVAFTVRP